MSENIENITEELMMRYVEGDMDSDESKKFEKILSKNEYLNSRVSILKSLVEDSPVKSPPLNIQNKILSDLNIADCDNDISFIKKNTDAFMSVFEKRPILMGSFLSGIAAVFALFIFIKDETPKTDLINYDRSDNLSYNEINSEELFEEDELKDIELVIPKINN